MPQRPPPPSSTTLSSTPESADSALKRGRGRPRKAVGGETLPLAPNPEDYTIDSPDIQFKVRELIKLAKEQGHVS